jgi:uncharacterized membrane protein HdeD (DUF308 family)
MMEKVQLTALNMAASRSGRLPMIQTLIRKWWLLASCGVIDAIISVIFLDHGGLSTKTAVAFLGNFTLAAGTLTIAAGILSLRDGKSWLLVMNGLACSALGLMLSFGASRAVTFRTIALFVVVMAVSIGVYELAMVRTSRRVAGEWLLGTAGVVSVGFALVFLAFIMSWIKLEPSPSGQTFNWLGSYFGFSAICVLGLALHLERPGRFAKSS